KIVERAGPDLTLGVTGGYDRVPTVGGYIHGCIGILCGLAQGEGGTALGPDGKPVWSLRGGLGIRF
ncbi:MAG: hypothetical protein RJA59_1225, partial [Pseudomonadota bacterium]